MRQPRLGKATFLRPIPLARVTASMTGPVPPMLVVPPQFDLSAMAGTAVIFSSVFFGAHTNTAQGSQSTYGTHELSVKQAAQTSSVWPSVRTPPAVTTSLPTFVYERPDDPVQTRSVIWSPIALPQGNLGQFVIESPQSDPTPIQPQVFKSIIGPSIPLAYTVTAPQLDLAVQTQIWGSARTPIVAAGVLSSWFKTESQFNPAQVQGQIWEPISTPSGWINLSVCGAPQDDPTLLQPQIFKSAATTAATSAQRLLPFVQTYPQIDPTQLPSQFFPSALTVTYAVKTRIETRPQDDPTQIAPQVFASVGTPPIITGTTVTQFVLNGQPDLNLYTVQIWTPSTFSPSAPPVDNGPPLGPIGPVQPYYPMAGTTRYVKPKKKKVLEPDLPPPPPEEIKPQPHPVEIIKLDTTGLEADLAEIKKQLSALNKSDQEAIEALFMLLMQ